MDSSTTVLSKEAPSYLRSYLTVFGISLIHLSTGTVMSWSSPMIPQLNLTSTQATFVGSLYSLGAAPGPFVVTFCLDTIGRKGTAHVLLSTYIISWILLLASKDITVIYIARLIGGIGVGGCCSGIPVYVSEMALTDIRGRLGSLSFMFIGVAALIVFGIGPHLSYYQLSIFGLAIAILFLVVSFFLPESPYYYIRKGRKEDAKAALRRMRGYTSDESMEEELGGIEMAIYQDQQNVVSFWESLHKRGTVKAILMGIFLVLTQQMTGLNGVNSYCQSIFESAKLNFDPTLVPFIYTLSNIIAMPSALLINKCLTVKVALVISGIGSGVFLGLVGLYFVLINNGVNLYEVSFISVVLLVLVNVMSGIGLGPLVWPLVAELLPSPVKGIGTGICGCISSLAGFAVITFFSVLANTYGFSASFFLFGALTFGSAIITSFIIPDTTGKSLQEIQELLVK